MAGLAPTLTKKEFNNWVKGALALLFTKEGLTDFVSTEIDRHHQRLLQLVPAGNMIKKCKCKINSLPPCTRRRNHSHIVPGPRQLCSRGVCNMIMDEVCKDHRFRGPSWKNTDPQKWCSDAFEVAKCFFPPDGYSHTTSLSETDFNGIVSVIINNLSFSTQIQDNLATTPNICTRARKVGREIRHTSDHLLSDNDLRDYIDDLINLLCDPVCLVNDPSAQDAVHKLRMLKTNDLTIHDKDITEALKETIKDTYSDEHRYLLKKINDHYSNLRTDSVAEIDRIVAVRKTELEELANKLTDDISRHAELKKHEIEQYDGTKEKKDYAKKLTALKEDLVTYYRENESMIPAAPLVDEHKVPVEDLFVLPPMRAYDKPLSFGPGKNTHKGDHISEDNTQENEISTVSQLFLSDKNVQYKKIYITANAGFGKTSLSQKLTMTWCQAHSPLTSLTKKYENEEIRAMKKFDYLFLLHLRGYQNETHCNLDDLIKQMVSGRLSRHKLCTEEFIERLLHENTCLIILDGLDEWVHPVKCYKSPAVPHNNHPNSCTVLTTSRPWKLGTIGLSENYIDQHVEILMLDIRTCIQLSKNAVQILNEKGLNLANKTISDFAEEVNSIKVGAIVYIPYILLQLMSLFFGGLPIGKSKCIVYSNIIEFTLKRGLCKKNIPDIHLQSNDNANVPNCMTNNKKCSLYFNLLMKLGKLAFFSLFNEKKESSLIFNRKYAKQFMTKQEIEFCLKIGLLCETKDSSIIAERLYQVYFQHKSVQEFFCAIYLTSEWQNESVKSTIFKDCSSLSSTLEKGNLFAFVCGMNPEVYTCISDEFPKFFDLDIFVDRCKKYMYMYENRYDDDYDDDIEIVQSYQSMQIQCLQECFRNGYKTCSIVVHDILIDEYGVTEDELITLKSIINFNKFNMRTLILSCPEKKIPVFLQSIDRGVFINLVILQVLGGSNDETRWLADIFNDSARTLKWLILSLEDGCSLSDICLTALTGLTFLKTLYLDHVHMTHSNLKCLYAYISQTTTLTQLKLMFLVCRDHKYQYRYCDVNLDLHRLNELEHVELMRINMSSASWRKLLLSASSLQHPVKVVLFKCSKCRGPSWQQWQTIVHAIKSTPTLSLLTGSGMDSYGFVMLNLTNTTVL